MKKVIVIEILTMKHKNKKQQKKNLVVTLLELILMGKMFIFVEIGKIYNHINESNKILTKISRTDYQNQNLKKIIQ